jgi:hypothetical protein
MYLLTASSRPCLNKVSVHEHLALTAFVLYVASHTTKWFLLLRLFRLFSEDILACLLVFAGFEAASFQTDYICANLDILRCND